MTTDGSESPLTVAKAKNHLLWLGLAIYIAGQQPVLASANKANNINTVNIDQWQHLKAAGDSALSVNNYGLAEQNLVAALQEAEKFAVADLRLADTLRSLADLYVTRGQYERAQPLYERELRIREKALGGEHPEVVACVGKLAQFYLNHGSAAKGDRLANLLLNFAERKVKEQQSLQENFSKLDRYYARDKDYTEAHTLLGQLQASTEKTTANQDLELATTLDALGHLYQSKNKYELSEKMYRNALSFRMHTLSPGHLALAVSYENLANLYAAEGKNSQAQPLFKQALDITEKTLQPERPEVFKRLDELAQTYVNMGQTAEAESLYKRALLILMKNQSDSVDSGKASFALAQLYIKQGKFSQAEPLVKRALAISQAVNGPQHASNALILDSYADVLEKMNKTSEAAKMRTRAKAIRGSSVVQKTDSGTNF